MPLRMCLLLFGATLLLLFVTWLCRPAAFYYRPMLPGCLLLDDAALLLFIIFRGHPAVAYYSPMLSRCCLFLANAGLLLFIIHRCRPDVVYFLFVVALLLSIVVQGRPVVLCVCSAPSFITFQGHLVGYCSPMPTCWPPPVVYYLLGPPCCIAR